MTERVERPGETGDPRRVDWGRVVAYGLLPALAMALAVTAGVLRWWDTSIREMDLARTESVQAATDSAVAVLSYRPDSVEQDVADARRLVTGGLLDRLTQLGGDRLLLDTQGRRVTAVASVPAAGVVWATGSHAVVLVFVDQTVTAESVPPTQVTSSYRVALDKVDGRWLASGLEQV